MQSMESSDNCVHRYNIEILNFFDLELQLINTEHMIKSKLKELLSELKKFKVQTILVLDIRKEMIGKSFIQVLNLKKSICDSVIDEAFKSMHQSIITKIKNSASKDWIVIQAIVKHSIKISEC